MGTFYQRKQSYASGTGGFTEDRHVVRVAAEIGNVLVNPLKCHHLVHQSQILRIRIVLTIREMGQMEETENTLSVFD